MLRRRELTSSYLDFARGVDTFLNALPGVSMYAIRQGFREAGVKDNEVLIFSGLMDLTSLFLTANCDAIYLWTYLNLRQGPMVVEAPAGVLAPGDDMWFRSPRREAAYFSQEYDADPKRLNGANAYTVTCPKGSLPPVRGF